MVSSLWTGQGAANAVGLIAPFVGKDFNILYYYVWEGTFQPSHAGAISQAQDAGVDLRNQLLRRLGPDCNQPIHFIGHSLGTVVNAYAAATFLPSAKSVAYVQFTASGSPGIKWGIFVYDGTRSREKGEVCRTVGAPYLNIAVCDHQEYSGLSRECL